MICGDGAGLPVHGSSCAWLGYSLYVLRLPYGPSTLFSLKYGLFSEPRFRAEGGSDRAIIFRSPMQVEGPMPTPKDEQL